MRCKNCGQTIESWQQECPYCYAKIDQPKESIIKKVENSEINENNVVIGTRGEAKQARGSVAIFCVLGGIFILNGLSLLLAKFATGYETIKLYSLVFFAFSILFFVAAYNGLKYARCNDAYLSKPVLVYDKQEDKFIGYDCRHGGKRLEIANGAILRIQGSAFFTARELFITYKNKNGKKVRRSFGFCRNIDNNVFKGLLNQYHNPKL